MISIEAHPMALLLIDGGAPKRAEKCKRVWNPTYLDKAILRHMTQVLRVTM